MKNLLKRYFLLGLIALGASTHYMPSTLAHSSGVGKRPSFEPLSASDQSIIDDITEKYELGKRGDYKGYVIPLFGNIACIFPHKKEIFVDSIWLDTASQEEKLFTLGHELGHVKVEPSRAEKLSHETQAWGKYYVTAGLTTTIGAYIGNIIGKKIDKQNEQKQNINEEKDSANEKKINDSFITYLFSDVAQHNCYSSRYADIGAMIGFALGCALHIRYILPCHIGSFSQKIEYAADEISVEKLGCYEGAIKDFNRYQTIQKKHDLAQKNGAKILSSHDIYPYSKPVIEYLMPQIDSHPSCEDRIARIQELQAARNKK